MQHQGTNGKRGIEDKEGTNRGSFDPLFYMRNKYKRSAFFDMSDDFFYQISLIGFLIVFSSMVFFLTKYREKKDNTISHTSNTELIKFLKL